MVGNLQRHGAIVLFSHDVSDITSYMTKLTVDGPSDIFCAATFLFALIGWGCMRLYVFPVMIYCPVKSPLMDELPGGIMFVGTLFALLGMHI